MSARTAIALGSIATALGMLWLSATMFWPMEYATPMVEGPHPLAIPIRTITFCLGLGAVALPMALGVLANIRKHGRLG